MADGIQFVIEHRWVYASSCYGSFTIPCTTLLKMTVWGGGSESRVGSVTLINLVTSYNSTFRYTGPWHARIAITFVLIYIFTRGFLQRFKHRIEQILSL